VAAALETECSEVRAVRRISFAARLFVGVNWITILGMLFANGISKDIGLGAFTVFRITSVVGILWLIAEGAEAFAGRTSFVRVLVDGLLILPMFALWWLVTVTSF
jgi:hypothetical protein